MNRERGTTQSGRSMIEMLGVLAIIGVLSVGGLAGYNMAMQKIRINKVVEEIQLTMATLDGFNPGSGNKVANLNYKKYIDTSSLEESLNVLGVTLRALGSGADTQYTYYLGLDNVSPELCHELINKLNDGTDSITVGGDSFSYVASVLLNSAEARKICQKEDSAKISMDFFFGSTGSAGKKEKQ